MTEGSRTLYVRALEALLKGEMAKVALQRDFRLLAEIARLAQSDAPVDFAATDPALFTSWRAAVTRYHVAGWTNMTPERVMALAATLQRKASEQAS
jgi:hypothetical protein